ncbi:uncharacterized protein DS421_6g178070 [Arachis hypogaea]|nr:uncharacterized protein DS421_6g178070 [Arachis hypogaea]
MYLVVAKMRRLISESKSNSSSPASMHSAMEPLQEEPEPFLEATHPPTIPMGLKWSPASAVVVVGDEAITTKMLAQITRTTHKLNLAIELAVMMLLAVVAKWERERGGRGRGRTRNKFIDEKDLILWDKRTTL